MKRVISIAKTYIHRGKRRHYTDTKKRWFIYYYDENWRFNSEQVSFAKAMYYKKRKFHRLRRYCEICGRTFVYLLKSKKERPECPVCKV